MGKTKPGRSVRRGWIASWRKKLDIDASEVWIERALRVGEKKTGQEYWIGQQIVVQFNRYKNKLDILRNFKNLNGTNFSVLKTLAKKPLVSERKNGKKY